MMTFLLQFFLDHQCINRLQIFKWFKNGNAHDVLAYKGFEQSKHLATPFIQSLEAKQTDVDQPVQIHVKQEPAAKQTDVDQSVQIQIKQEPAAKQTDVDQSVQIRIKQEPIAMT